MITVDVILLELLWLCQFCNLSVLTCSPAVLNVLQTLRNEIYEEYFRLKNDNDYVKDRNRYEFLVKKLVHIKQLVYAYDHDHPAVK